MTRERLCPRCGAYWQCDCRLDDAPAGLSYVPLPSCEHDWTDAVGVDVDSDLLSPEARVQVCRLCGLHAVHAPDEGVRGG